MKIIIQKQAIILNYFDNKYCVKTHNGSIFFNNSVVNC